VAEARINLRRRALRVLVSAPLGVLAFVLWDHTAPQPRVQVDAVQLRKVPSTGQPGLVELVLRNNGNATVHMVVFPVAHLGGAFGSAQQLAAANMQRELAARLEEARPLPPAGTIDIEEGQTTLVNIEVPFTERAWLFGRGEATLIVAARVRYRDRVFHREKVFCQFTNPRSGAWVSCPFLNN
jgi:hypothetical protein